MDCNTATKGKQLTQATRVQFKLGADRATASRCNDCEVHLRGLHPETEMHSGHDQQGCVGKKARQSGAAVGPLAIEHGQGQP